MLDFFSTTFHVFSLCVSLLFCLFVCVSLSLSLALSLSLSLCFCCPSVPSSVPFPVCSFTHKLIYNLLMPNKRSLCVSISPCYLPPTPTPTTPKKEERKKRKKKKSLGRVGLPSTTPNQLQTKLGHTVLGKTRQLKQSWVTRNFAERPLKRS